MTLEYIESVEALEALYGEVSSPALRKVVHRMTPLYRQWIGAARWCVLATVGPEGVDASPRGDDGPVVTELDPQTLAMPDWRGNNRLDSLRNIVRDDWVGLLFLVPGTTTAVRVNGRARVTADATLRARFERKGIRPATVIVISIGEIYTQCGRAALRAGLWSRDDSALVPSVGEILAEVTDGTEGGTAYDSAWTARAQTTMW